MNLTERLAQEREARAGFRPPVSGKPTHGVKSAPVDISRLDLGAIRAHDTRCLYCGHPAHPGGHIGAGAPWGRR